MNVALHKVRFHRTRLDLPHAFESELCSFLDVNSRAIKLPMCGATLINRSDPGAVLDFSARVSIPDQIFSERGIGTSKFGYESAVEGFESPDAIQVGFIESRHSELRFQALACCRGFTAGV